MATANIILHKFLARDKPGTIEAFSVILSWRGDGIDLHWLALS
jgi:hypothetical protein